MPQITMRRTTPPEVPRQTVDASRSVVAAVLPVGANGCRKRRAEKGQGPSAQRENGRRAGGAGQRTHGGECRGADRVRSRIWQFFFFFCQGIRAETCPSSRSVAAPSDLAAPRAKSPFRDPRVGIPLRSERESLTISASVVSRGKHGAPRGAPRLQRENGGASARPSGVAIDGGARSSAAQAPRSPSRRPAWRCGESRPAPFPAALRTCAQDVLTMRRMEDNITDGFGHVSPDALRPSHEQSRNRPVNPENPPRSTSMASWVRIGNHVGPETRSKPYRMVQARRTDNNRAKSCKNLETRTHLKTLHVYRIPAPAQQATRLDRIPRKGSAKRAGAIHQTPRRPRRHGHRTMCNWTSPRPEVEGLRPVKPEPARGDGLVA